MQLYPNVLDHSLFDQFLVLHGFILVAHQFELLDCFSVFVSLLSELGFVVERLVFHSLLLFG